MKSEKEIYSLSMWDLTNDISELIYITETDLQTSKKKLRVTNIGKMGHGKDKLEAWD